MVQPLRHFSKRFGQGSASRGKRKKELDCLHGSYSEEYLVVPTGVMATSVANRAIPQRTSDFRTATVGERPVSLRSSLSTSIPGFTERFFLQKRNAEALLRDLSPLILPNSCFHLAVEIVLRNLSSGDEVNVPVCVARASILPHGVDVPVKSGYQRSLTTTRISQCYRSTGREADLLNWAPCGAGVRAGCQP